MVTSSAYARGIGHQQHCEIDSGKLPFLIVVLFVSTILPTQFAKASVIDRQNVSGGVGFLVFSQRLQLRSRPRMVIRVGGDFWCLVSEDYAVDLPLFSEVMSAHIGGLRTLVKR